MPHLATADDAALLGALPIAAAIIGMGDDGSLNVLSHNNRFKDTVELSTCTALNWNDAECLRDGPISDLLHAFFANPIGPDELDFRDGDGVAGRYFRLKLAPLPAGGKGTQRCLLSVVDRTVEAQAERALRAEMLRDSLTGLPNRLAFTEKVEQQELERLRAAAVRAANSGLQVNAGHGINYRNILQVNHIPHLTELNIGHSIVARAIWVGIESAVSEMLALMQNYRG